MRTTSDPSNFTVMLVHVSSHVQSPAEWQTRSQQDEE